MFCIIIISIYIFFSYHYGNIILGGVVKLLSLVKKFHIFIFSQSLRTCVQNIKPICGVICVSVETVNCAGTYKCGILLGTA